MVAAVTENLSVSDRMFCSFCDTPFNDRRQQKSHYKSDWHRFNLKQKLKCQPTLSEELFEETMGDISSISGSGSDTSSSATDGESESRHSDKPKVKLSAVEREEESGSDMEGVVEGVGRLSPWVFFRNPQEELLSIHRVVLLHKKAPGHTPTQLVELATGLPGHMKWAVLMAGGGHFAAALFDGAQVVAHKTFHRYVVRAKRGTAQSTRDGQGNAPKSGGASLRRYNEAALTQEIQELLKTWSNQLRQCDRIFLRAPSFNRAIFFGGREAPLRKDDLRIRTIPIQTRRPTFHEVQRIHRLLATVRCHGRAFSVPRPVQLSPKKDAPVRNPPQTKPAETINKDDCPQGVVAEVLSPYSTVTVAPPSDQESSSDTEIQFSLHTLDTAHLKEYDCSVKPRRRKGKGENISRKTEPKQKEPPVMDESSRKLRNHLYTACKSCDLESLRKLLQDLCLEASSTEHCTDLEEQQNIDCSPSDGLEEQQNREGAIQVQSAKCERTDNVEKGTHTNIDNSKAGILNMTFGDGQRTLLHVTAEAGSIEMVSALLRAGADPMVKDKQGRTPYAVASNKHTRNEFRRFRTEFPDKYNYEEAKIPEALSQELEDKKKEREAARKRAQRKAKKERLKDQKAEEAKKLAETKETDRFLGLSDREKRALMAERRLLGQMSTQGDTAVVLSRCWQCGADISGKVPFEYLDFRFCSPRCLKQHRTSHKS
ncbi:hypothetical protein NP493_849g01024 [Ridgeia piscesae]|uniref:VLRF1 domain-containing protein n=1 Tax=Ridgeia piscesae TaxID=27915 RepID=A0AAD9KM08_RIDPI|nr:hypothetical protein NP493_849g01024 [Ridgeia piscesae]